MVHVGFSKKFDRKSWSIIDIFKEGASCWQKKICQILKWRSLCLISYTEILCGQNRRSWKFTWGHGGSRKVAIFYKNTLSNFFPRWRSRWSCDIDELIIFLFHGSKIKMQCYLSSEKISNLSFSHCKNGLIAKTWELESSAASSNKSEIQY